MAYNATKFRSFLKNSGFRPNLYAVSLAFPNGNPELDEAFTFLCRSASLPGMNIGIATASYFGRTVKFAGDRTWEDWSVTVYVDEDFKVRNAFEAWQNRMGFIDHGTEAITQMCDNSSYYVDVNIKALGKNGALCGGLGSGDDGLKRYTLKNAWPTSVGAIDMAYDSNDTIATFTVNFSFDYMVTDKIVGHTDSI